MIRIRVSHCFAHHDQVVPEQLEGLQVNMRDAGWFRPVFCRGVAFLQLIKQKFGAVPVGPNKPSVLK